jgi:hypothetical protein
MRSHLRAGLCARSSKVSLLATAAREWILRVSGPFGILNAHASSLALSIAEGTPAAVADTGNERIRVITLH